MQYLCMDKILERAFEESALNLGRQPGNLRVVRQLLAVLVARFGSAGGRWLQRESRSPA